VRDSHGCYTAGGYVWDVRYRNCIRPWLQHVAILNIQSEKVPCVINGTSSGCLAVHNRLGVVPLLDPIWGFDFVPGFSYRLLLADQINETNSSRTYTLMRILAQIDQTYTGIVGKRWNIVSLDGNLINSPGYITFSRGAVSGKLCNNFSGNYTIDWDTFSAPSIITTEMYCSTDIMPVENVFQLHGATYSLSGDYLTIRTRTDHVITWKRG
jgi:heat shock protein HslJ